MNSKFDLQYFAAGENVHGTEGYVNANNPKASTQYSSEAPGLSAEMKTFYDKTLIELASPNLVFDQLGQKRPIPAGAGKSIEFRRFNSLPKAMKPITEGVTPAGSKLTVTPVTSYVDQYGDYVELTDMLELTSVDPVVVEATKQLADQAGRTVDTVVRNQLMGGTNVYYCPEVDENGNETEITARHELTENCRLRVKDVFRAAALLKAMNAPTIDGSYVAVIHPYVAYDLMQDASGQWLDIQKYTSPENILNGEIGTLSGVRFVQSSEAKIYYGEELAEGTNALSVTAFTSKATDTTATAGITTAYRATVTDNITEELIGRQIAYTSASGVVAARCDIVGVNTAAKYVYLEEAVGVTYAAGDKLQAAEGGKNGIATFATLFIGANAYGTTDIAGGGIEHIIKQKGYGNDPLNQRSSVGWKATKTAARLVEEYMLRVESASSFSGNIHEEN